MPLPFRRIRDYRRPSKPYRPRGWKTTRQPRYQPRKNVAQTNSLQPWGKNYVSKKNAGELGSYTTALTNSAVTLQTGQTSVGASISFQSSTIPSQVRDRYNRIRIKKVTIFMKTESAQVGTWQFMVAKDSDNAAQNILDLRRQAGAVSKLVTTGPAAVGADDAVRLGVMWPINPIDDGSHTTNNIFSASKTDVTLHVCHYALTAAGPPQAAVEFSTVYYMVVDYIGYNKE